MQVLACLLQQRDSCKRSIRTARGTKSHPNIGPRETLAAGSGAVSPLVPVYSHGVLPLLAKTTLHLMVRACHHLWMFSVRGRVGRMLYLTVAREGGAREGALAADDRAGRCERAPANPQRPNILPCCHMTAHHNALFYSYLRRHANKRAALPHVCPHDGKEACPFLASHPLCRAAAQRALRARPPRGRGGGGGRGGPRGGGE